MTKYTGGCHCGAVKYEVEASLDNPVTCNCSHCQMLGAVMVFVPATNFTLLSGADKLTEYRFNKKIIAHKFCSICGIESFSDGVADDGTASTMINVNCLDGVDPKAMTPYHYDGRAV